MLKTLGLAILGLSASTLLAGNNGGQGQSDADNLVTTLCQQAAEGSPSCPGNKYGTPNGGADPNTVRVYIADARARTLTGEETSRTVTFVEDSEQETSGNYVDPATGEIDGKFSHRITFTSLDYRGEATFKSQLTLKVEYTVPEGDVELNGSTAKTGCIHTFSRLTGNSGDTLADIINEAGPSCDQGGSNNGGNGTAAADLVIFITEDESGLGYHVDLEEDFGANGKPALEAAIAAKAEGLRGDSASELLHTLTVDQQIYSGDVDYALDSGFKIENILDCAKHDNATPNYDQDGFLLGSQMWDRFSDLQVVAAGGQGTINYIDFAKITETETLQVNPEGDLFYVTCLVSTTLKETSGEKRNRATLKTLSFEQIINSKLEEPSND